MLATRERPRDLAAAPLVLLLAALAAGCRPEPPEPSKSGGESARRDAVSLPHAILFQSERGGGVDVWRLPGDGSEPSNLTGNGARGYNDRHPTASSDGTRIAFGPTATASRTSSS